MLVAASALLAGQLQVWDTVQPGADIASRNAWVALSPNAPAKGDVVIANGRVTAIARKRDGGVELYSNSVSRARLVVGPPERLSLVEMGKGSACIDTGSAKFRLKRGDVTIQVEPGPGAERLRFECPSRFALLPDFFADDVLLDPRRIPTESAQVPSENFLLHFAGNGDSMAMIVSESRDRDMKLALTGTGESRSIVASEIPFGGAKKKIWVSLLEGPGVWHTIELKISDAQKVIPLDWKMPFVGVWRADFSRPNDLADSWDMLLQNKKGQEYIKPAWFGGPAEEVNDATRRRFTEVLGFFPYPVWSDPERRGYLQPLDIETRTKFVTRLTYQGPVVIYPFNRLSQTPPDAFTVVDIARNALGVGPCDYILDLENQKQEYKGQATCPTGDALVAIYEKGHQKRRRDEIEKCLADALAFVTHIRGRISAYVEFGHKMRDYFAAQKKAWPELKDAVGELEKIVDEIDARFAEREERIKTPAYVASMNDEFRKNVLDREGPEALEDCKKYAEALVRIGGNQDKLVSECRWVARVLRQKAALLVAAEPKLAPLAEEVRNRSLEVLRRPSRHERGRQ